MPIKQAKQGFTLIELLVVVLIIGILASIALPQYKIAVMRSRVGAMLPVLESIAKAQEIYFMENDRYASKVSDLDINIPSEVCSHFNFSSYDSTGNGELLACGTDFFIDNYAVAGAVCLNYCPGSASTWNTCKNSRILRMDYNLSFNDVQSNVQWCSVFKNNKEASRICAGFPNFTKRNQ